MTYGIIKVINGTYHIHAEGIKTLAQAKVSFHGLCQTLWNAPDVRTAMVMIADENLDAVEGCKEYVHHETVIAAAAAAEPEAEPTE